MADDYQTAERLSTFPVPNIWPNISFLPQDAFWTTVPTSLSNIISRSIPPSPNISRPQLSLTSISPSRLIATLSTRWTPEPWPPCWILEPGSGFRPSFKSYSAVVFIATIIPAKYLSASILTVPLLISCGIPSKRLLPVLLRSRTRFPLS